MTISRGMKLTGHVAHLVVKHMQRVSVGISEQMTMFWEI